MNLPLGGIPKVKLQAKGKAVNVPQGCWRCHRCGTVFSCPKLAGSPEVFESLCITCHFREVNAARAEEIRKKA